VLKCEWYGNCKDYMALHRYNATFPECLIVEIGRKKNRYKLN